MQKHSTVFCKIVIGLGLLFTATTGSGQQIQLTTNNGLSTNTIYCVMVDHQGYLWLGTDDGVYRYNGFYLKHYGLSDGLPTKQIWWLYQDNAKRILLHSISDKLAYINNEKTGTVVSKPGNMLYPSQPVIKNGFIVFLSKYNTRRGTALCLIKNDTLSSYDLPIPNVYTILIEGKIITISENDQVTKHVYRFQNDSLMIYKEDQFLAEGINSIISKGINLSFKNYLLSYKIQDTLMSVLDLDSRKLRVVKTGDKINLACVNNDMLYLVGNRSIYQLDAKLEIKALIPVAAITGDTTSGFEVTNLIFDSLWGTCLTTKKNGAYVRFAMSVDFGRAISLAPQMGTLVGKGLDNTSFRWDPLNKKLLEINNAGSRSYKINGTEIIESAIPYNKDTLLLFGPSGVYWFNLRIARPALLQVYQRQNGKLNPSGIGGFYGIVLNQDSLYVVSRTGGLHSIHKKGDIFLVQLFSDERYKGIAYDSKRNALLAYTDSKIEVFKHNRKLLVIEGEILRRARITFIEKILADSFGNIFVQTNDRLLYLDNSGMVNDLSAGYILEKANVVLHDDLIVVAGKFGVCFRRITGAGKMNTPIVYENTKAYFYKVVDDISITGNHLVLKTDRGGYTMAIPESNGRPVLETGQSQYKLIATAGGVSQHISAHDTIFLGQADPNIRLDLIKPAGIGVASYSYMLKGTNAFFMQASTNNIFLSSLKPDQLYSLFIRVGDETWKSKIIPVYVYVIPYWWQKSTIRPLIWSGLLLLVSGLIAFIVWATRKTVAKRYERKNQLNNLELKAIHAQINPHFIFNTLGVAQYFIAKNENDKAANHLQKFSRLLRNYLKSSRNKLTSLEEEVKNLRDYIELQQIRFIGKFDFEIVVDENIDLTRTKIPSLLLQPIVENAINHGLFHLKNNGHLKVEFSKGITENELVCIVDDNGIGRNAAKLIKENTLTGASYGSHLIDDLINVFKRFEQMDISIFYEDKKVPLTGTTVKVVIKYL